MNTHRVHTQCWRVSDRATELRVLDVVDAFARYSRLGLSPRWVDSSTFVCTCPACRAADGLRVAGADAERRTA